MPKDLILVRHGYAEGNKAYAEEKKGNYQFFSPKFLETHESQWRLTSKGREQSRAAGEWIKKNVSYFFGQYLCSEYIRALETAALLNLPHANWTRNVFLHERNFGKLSRLSYAVRQKRFEAQLKWRERDAFYWKPPSGESLADVALRVDYILDQLSEFPIQPSSAIIVTHFHVMQVLRTRIEMIPQSEFRKKLVNNDESEKLKNAAIIHYTRIDPVTKEVEPVYKWMKIVIPWIKKYSNPDWKEIIYPTFTNEGLKREIEESSRNI
ncbi:phosphoglycerate mutase family protein [Histomonas meleagridis]|uniref:phosphoglycerate mutase family protein n=1 Tax=Histomonas meleagridis TaxID=135588 RepID=UPI003559BB86|nr:phosphoglycerate mutase family protein [Histomonas meleagridis]KAH0799970.1 phosphoglycerate mutase family protein [Histomonas meleagridis]